MRFIQVLILGLFLLPIRPAASSDEDLAKAKIHLKDYLKALNRQYPFQDWEKQLVKSRKSLEKARLTLGEGYGRGQYSTLETLGREMSALARLDAETGKLMRELSVSVMVQRIEAMFQKEGAQFHPEAKLAFERALRPYETGSLRPKADFRDRLAAIDREYRRLQTDWLYAFSQDFLGRRVEEHLKAYSFAQNEAVFDDYSLQLDYWSRETAGNAVQASEQLQALSAKFDAAKGRIRQNLEGLLEVLNTDMLFSDLLEFARKQGVEINLEVEERIEASLKERSRANLQPIQDRLAAWKDFAYALKDRALEARTQGERQKSMQVAREEMERREQERLEALREEQKRLEREQKEKFKQTLTALKTFTFKSETSVELDDESQQALKTKSGFLKTSYVRSGQNKLKVDKGSSFSDTLAFVQKFRVEDGKVDLSKMSLQERSNQSAYVYSPPSGRTSKADLEEFVAEVALSSFSTPYSFLSYLAPSRWRPGRLAWMPDRTQDKAVQDREFSYVDLVVDAHRKRTGGGKGRAEHTVNLPANMIVIFDAKGAIIRFQTFADIDQVAIQSGDLAGGKLHYKFLNYSVDRRAIYLNGIDQETKVSSPGG